MQNKLTNVYTYTKVLYANTQDAKLTHYCIYIYESIHRWNPSEINKN